MKEKTDFYSAAARSVNGAVHGFGLVGFLHAFIRIDEAVVTTGHIPKLRPVLATAFQEGVAGAKVVGG